jgi:transposase
MSRPGMRFVPVKSAEQQAALMMLRRRELLVKQRTLLINAIRGHAAEFGVVAAKGVAKVSDLRQRAHAEEAGVPALALDMLRLLASQLEALELKLKTIEARLMAWHKQDPVSQCLATQPGIGPIGAVSFALKVTDPKAFRSGRHFAAWLGADPEGTRPAVARGRAGSAGRAMKACAGSWCSAPPRWCSSPSRAGPRPG